MVGRLGRCTRAARVAVAIDVRDGRRRRARLAAGTAGIDAAAPSGGLADVGVETFEVTAIERDGLLEGPDLALYERLVALDRGAIIASGGIASLDDIRAVRAIGCSGAIVGRALYEGRLSLLNAIDWSASPADTPPEDAE